MTGRGLYVYMHGCGMYVWMQVVCIYAWCKLWVVCMGAEHAWMERREASRWIIDIMCGIRHSAVLTGSGKIWVTGGIRKEKAQVKKDLGEVAEEEKYDPELKFEKGKKDKSMKMKAV